MPISGPGGVPVDLLLRATTLDESQAAALAACLTRELSVVQGPPGCGGFLVKRSGSRAPSVPLWHDVSPTDIVTPADSVVLTLCHSVLADCTTDHTALHQQWCAVV